GERNLDLSSGICLRCEFAYHGPVLSACGGEYVEVRQRRGPIDGHIEHARLHPVGGAAPGKVSLRAQKACIGASTGASVLVPIAGAWTPQPHSVPSLFTTIVAPTLTVAETTPVSPGTWAGIVREFVLPSPKYWPQVQTVPSNLTASLVAPHAT